MLLKVKGTKAHIQENSHIFFASDACKEIRIPLWNTVFKGILKNFSSVYFKDVYLLCYFLLVLNNFSKYIVTFVLFWKFFFEVPMLQQ